MTSYPPSGDGENEQSWNNPQGSGGYPPGGQGGYPQQPGGYPGAYPPPPGQQGNPQQGYYQQQPGFPGAYPSTPGGGGGQPPSFFGALFDFNFSRFATPTVIKVLYILIMVVVFLTWIGYIIAGFSYSAILGIVAVIVGAIIALLAITFYRVVLEFFYAVVRMSEDIHNRR